MILIGLGKVLLHQLKIKDNVDHAGHFQLLEVLKDLVKSHMKLYKASQSNNSLIVLAIMVI